MMTVTIDGIEREVVLKDDLDTYIRNHLFNEFFIYFEHYLNNQQLNSDEVIKYLQKEIIPEELI